MTQQFGFLKNPYCQNGICSYHVDFVKQEQGKSFSIAAAPITLRAGKLMKQEVNWLRAQASWLNAVPMINIDDKWYRMKE